MKKSEHRKGVSLSNRGGFIKIATSIDYRLVNFCARLCLGLVFIVAGGLKLTEPSHFAQRLGDFGLVFDTLVKPAAWVVMGVEVITGVALIFRWRGSLRAAGLTLMVFICVLFYGTNLGLDIDCGCFGPAVRISLKTQLLVDCGLLSICGIIYFTEGRQKTIDRDLTPSTNTDPDQ